MCPQILGIASYIQGSGVGRYFWAGGGGGGGADF